MSLLNTTGVILKTLDYKENDKLVWLFTEGEGKISSIGRGAKKSKNKLFSITLPLCYGEFQLFKGKGLYNLQEGKIINSFQGLLNNLHKLTYSSYLCELIDIALVEGEPNKEIFKDLITTLYLLNTDALEYELLIRAFELRLLKGTGYGLTLDKCTTCGKKIGISNFISLSHYGGVCDECNKDHGWYISKGAYNALKFLTTVNPDKIYRLNLTDDIKKEIEKVTSFIISNNYAKKPKSLDMLNYLKE
ncbi:MAG: DNA repair protein RecO [Clostridium sp.]